MDIYNKTELITTDADGKGPDLSVLFPKYYWVK